MKVKVGDKLPDAKVFLLEKDPKEVSVKKIINGEKSILFGLPGAFTPTCSGKHLPSFINASEEIKKWLGISMKLSEKFTIVLGIMLVGIFVIGLAWSISTGLAGFWKGIPFWIIVIFCLSLLIYDSLKSIKK